MATTRAKIAMTEVMRRIREVSLEVALNKAEILFFYNEKAFGA